MDDCRKIDLEFEDDGLLADNHFSENLVGFNTNTNELVGGLNLEKDVDNDIIENDKLSELHEPMEPVGNHNKGRYNLRKSLAWDSAFFTSAGVLDPDELTMITGEKRLLPRIQEELTDSTESFSSLGSDTLTMETLEDGLFLDIRASIQRSSKRATDLRILNSKTAAMEVDSAEISSLEEDTVTQITTSAVIEKTPKPGVKKSNSLATDRIPKSQPKQNIGKIGLAKSIKQDPVHSQTPVANIGGTKSVLLKTPKIISRSIPSSPAAEKRESVGTGHARSASGISNPATGKRLQPPKVSSSGVPRRGALPKSSLSSSSLSASSNAHSTGSSTSSDSSSNMPSRLNPGRSNLMTARRNTGKSGDVGTGPIPKTPSRATPTLKNKLPPPSSSSSSSSTLSAYMTSNKISSNVSPASSISDWSSVSSSSMVDQKSSNLRTSVESIDSSSCISTEGGITHLEPRHYPAGQNADTGHKSQGVGLTSNNSKKSSVQTGGSLHAPAKPSGLRMPSHKFGFFDGGKSSTRSPNRPQQFPSAANNGIPKNSIPIRASNNKQKSGKAPTTRMATSPANIKPRSLKPISPASSNPSSPKLSFSQQKSHALADASTVSKDVVKGSTTSEEEAEKGNEVANTGVAIIESFGDLKISDVVAEKVCTGKDFEPTCKATEKENGYDQRVNGLTDEISGDNTSPCRAPLALKNSFASDECSDMPKEFVAHVADETGFPLPEIEL